MTFNHVKGSRAFEKKIPAVEIFDEDELQWLNTTTGSTYKSTDKNKQLFDVSSVD